MQRVPCKGCGAEKPRGEIFRLNDKQLCEECANKELQLLQQAGSQPSQIYRDVDPTVCNQCKADYGSTALSMIGGVPFCATCSQGLYGRPFPGWLKGSLAAMLLLLVVALWHGLPYFKAGRSLVLGERAIERHEYSKAAANLEDTLRVAPRGQKQVLLTAKAYLLAGDFEGAQKAFKHRDRYEDNALFREVTGMWERATHALDKVAEASKVMEQGKDEDAARLMHEAAREFPESVEMAIAADMADGGVAFEHKDYDGFLKFSQIALQRAPEDPEQLAGVASALACKYAVSGNAEFRTQAEEMLAKSKALAEKSPEAKKSYEEYSERILYRLRTRDIIDKKEYDRRFRPQGDSKGNS